MLTKLISRNADENAFKPLCKRLHLVKLKIGSYKVYYVNQPDGSIADGDRQKKKVPKDLKIF